MWRELNMDHLARTNTLRVIIKEHPSNKIVFIHCMINLTGSECMWDERPMIFHSTADVTTL